MLGRFVEVADDQRHLSVHRGFLIISDAGSERHELGRIPIDDISAVIANAHGLTYTNNFLVALAGRGIPFVLCGQNHNAAGMLLTLDGHHQQAARFDAQIGASRPLMKRLWMHVVRAKLMQQAAVLQHYGIPSVPLTALVRKVRSGDPANVEAQGARRYWTLLFGTDFRRDQQGDGANVLLNYGYTVLRATMARAVVAAGLHPSIGLHHSNAGNPMRLVDDLMEPYRPFVDRAVKQLSAKGGTGISAEEKRALVRVMFEDLRTPAGRSPLCVCAQRTATSLAQVLLGEATALDLPEFESSSPDLFPDD